MLLLFYDLLNLTGQKNVINYFGHSSMLNIYQKNFKKAMIQRIYWVVSSQANVKRASEVMVNRKNLFNKHDHFFLWPYLHHPFVSNVQEKVVDLYILITARAILMNFCLVNTSRSQILIRYAKYCGCFSKCIFLSYLLTMHLKLSDLTLQVQKSLSKHLKKNKSRFEKMRI